MCLHTDMLNSQNGNLLTTFSTFLQRKTLILTKKSFFIVITVGQSRWTAEEKLDIYLQRLKITSCHPMSSFLDPPLVCGHLIYFVYLVIQLSFNLTLLSVLDF